MIIFIKIDGADTVQEMKTLVSLIKHEFNHSVYLLGDIPKDYQTMWLYDLDGLFPVPETLTAALTLHNVKRESVVKKVVDKKEE